jgi:hypothetical protein
MCGRWEGQATGLIVYPISKNEMIMGAAVICGHVAFLLADIALYLKYSGTS